MLKGLVDFVIVSLVGAALKKTEFGLLRALGFVAPISKEIYHRRASVEKDRDFLLGVTNP
jgi:hypothetical protein